MIGQNKFVCLQFVIFDEDEMFKFRKRDDDKTIILLAQVF